MPVDKFVYHFKGTYHSINYFAHIHTGKAALNLVLNVLGLGSLNEICDTGIVFADHIDPKISLLLIFSVVLTFLSFTFLLKPTLEKWESGKRYFVFIIYVFAGAHILKCLVDGGLFSYDLLPSLIAIHLLYNSGEPRPLVECYRTYKTFYYFITFLFLTICAYISRLEFLQTLIGLAFISSTYFLLFLPFIPNKIRSLRFILITILCSLVILFYWSTHGLKRIEEIFSIPENIHKVIKFDYPAQGKNPHISDLTLETQGVDFANIYRKSCDNPLRNRNTAIFINDEKKYTGAIFVLKIFGRSKKIRLKSNSFMHIDEMSRYYGYKEGAYQMKVTFNPEFFPSLWSKNLSMLLQNNRYFMLFYLNHYFLNNGITEYAIIPFYYFMAP
ncbi:MAG: hypothetical protein ABH859_02475 [Pseudomonadota bacterium]